METSCGLRAAAFVLIAATPLLTVQGSAYAAKPGSSPDACANAVDFPAFSLRQQKSTGWALAVADATGKCIRQVVASASGAPPKFAYPVRVGESSLGRVVWRSGSNEAGYTVVDFAVDGTNVSVVGTRTIAGECCAYDLSRDGRTLYYGLGPDATTLATLDLSNPGALPEIIATVEPTWFFGYVSVNGDGSMIFAELRGQLTNALNSELVRLDRTTSGWTMTVLRQALGFQNIPYRPAIELAGAGARLAYLDYIPGSNNCTQLVIADVDANPIHVFSTPRYGNFPTWINDAVAMEHRDPPDRRGKCASSTSISRVDLTDESETILATGYSPDGR